MPGGIAPWKKPRAERVQQVTAMTLSGKTAKDIAEDLSLSRSMVHKYILDAREAGLLPPRRVPHMFRGRNDPPAGSMALMLATLPDHVRIWVYSQVPGGGTVAELVAGIITDAYQDELEGR